jgi:hypothetical protein
MTKHIPKEFKESGLEFASEKFKLIGKKVPLECPFESSNTGIVLLGVPCGNEAYIASETQTIMNGYLEDNVSLSKLHPQAAFLILQQCINKRPGYLARVVEYKAQEAFEFFDNAITDKIREISDTIVGNNETLRKRIHAIRSFPERMGGLGLPLVKSPYTDSGIEFSRSLTNNYVSKHVQLLKSDRPEQTTALSDWIGQMESLGDARPEEVDITSQKGCIEGYLKEKLDEFINSDAALTPTEQFQLRSWAFSNSARWTRWTGDTEHETNGKDRTSN